MHGANKHHLTGIYGTAILIKTFKTTDDNFHVHVTVSYMYDWDRFKKSNTGCLHEPRQSKSDSNSLPWLRQHWRWNS